MKIQLLIEMDEQGNVAVNGPIGDKRLCYAMVELARDAIKDFGDKARAEQPTIVPADANAVAALRDRRLTFGADVGRPNGR